MAKKTVVNVMVDFSEAFTDPNGSFYCGTTDDQKQNARKVGEGADLHVYVSDVHTRASSEFLANHGPYPTHNLIASDRPYHAELGVQEGQTSSPQLTAILLDMVRDKRSGLIVPRHVFFQDYDGEPADQVKPAFAFEEVEETFGVPRLVSQAFLDGGIDYIVNAKHMFNGAGLQSTEWIGHVDGVPDMEMNAFTLLKQKYGQGENLVFNINGVVMGICNYNTASGLRQMFPKAEINMIADGSTHLLGKQFGFANITEATLAARSMCEQIGVNYITTEHYLHDLSGSRK